MLNIKIFSLKILKKFENINTEDISEINKVLLDNHIKQFTDMINSTNPIQMKPIDENKSIDDRYNDLMYNRNLPLNVQIEAKNDKMTPLHNQNPLFDNQDTTFLLPDVKQQNITEVIHEQKEETPISNLINEEKKKK